MPALAAAACQSPAAGAASAASAADLATRCAALQGRQVAAIDAPTVVTSAKVVGAAELLPAYCQVQATIKPNIGIELRLPLERWNGKFLEYGRGGYCRGISMQECDNPLRKGYACVITDHGHKTFEQDDIWVHDNLQARVDCGFRATHVAAVAGKALTETFYSRAPRYSYYAGCSTGGRLGMVEAQRFPLDFDGIIAGAAPIEKTRTSLALTWASLATVDAGGRQLFREADIRFLARAVLARCDADDGIVDGVVGAPLQCKFDPETVRCAGGLSSNCLSAAQVAAVRKLYQGPVLADGTRLYEGGVLPGSEANWLGSFVAAPGQAQSVVYDSMVTLFRYLNDPPRAPDWNLSQFDWQRDSRQLGIMEALNSGANPDLRAFKAAGGKLIVYHGLADELVTPENMIAYYQTVERTMGGAAATRDFFRLFMVPGLNHCTGGAGATVIDYVAALEDWVERGRAPAWLTGAHLKPTAAPGAASVLPLQPIDIAFTRPHYAWPQRAQYQGSGDANDAANFKPAPSAPQ